MPSAARNIPAFVRALKELAPAFDLDLDEPLIQTLAAHYALLMRWNQKIHLTSIVDPTEAARFHYLESLYATRYLPPQPGRLADIGSGAGFPGFPLAACRPQLDVVLIESQVRKAAFLRTASHQSRLRNLTVFHGQFQTYPRRDIDRIACRAIDRFGDILPEILAWGRPAEQLLFFMGRDLADHCLALAESRWEVDVSTIPLSEQRVLISLSAVRST